MDGPIAQRLVDIVGADNYTDRVTDMVSYAYDASSYHRRPDCALWPVSTGQVSKILALADETRIPVTARGAGTGLSGLAVPARGGIVLDLARMNRIVEINIADRLAVVQPGVVYEDFQRALAPYGFFYPPDPASGMMCTLGGNVGTNAGGLRGAKYGTTRDYVLALEVVLADGSVMRTGARTMKCSSGYDLTRLFVGSEGTLGVCTEITLKVRPKPACTATAMASFESLEDAGAAVTMIMQSEVTPSVLELMDAAVIAMLREHAGSQLPPDAAAVLLAETDGSIRADVEHQLQLLVTLFTRCGAGEVETAASAAEAERLWTHRKAIGGMVGTLPYEAIPEDVTVPMSRIAEYLRGTRKLAETHGLPVFTHGHAGDGNFHTNILYDRSDPGQEARVGAALYDLHKLACDLGGTLSGEHGIGKTKAPYMPLEHDPVAMRVMRTLKRSLDPHNILNPGTMSLDE